MPTISEEANSVKPPTRAPGAYVPPSIRKGEPADSQTRQRGNISSCY